ACEALRQRNAARRDTEKDHAVQAGMPFGDLVCQPQCDARHPGRVEQLRAAAGGDGQLAHASNISSRAMRIATPFAAWRKYAARGSASTSVAISSTRGSG